MLAYRPDDDLYTEGIFTQISNAVPTNRGGYQNVYDSQDLGYTSLPGTALASSFLRRLDGTARVFVATSADIYEASQATTSGNNSWTDVGRASTTYSPATSWTFAQFGDVSLAASAENRLQFSNGAIGTAFADVTNAPFGKIVFTMGKRVILLNTSGYTGSGADGWAASTEGDYFTSTLWPPSPSNNAAFGTLNEVGGPLVAGTSLGSLALAWKRTGLWIGQDQGPPVQITWQKIPGDFGCVGIKAWCAIEGGVLFVSPQDIYIFDGSRPRSVSDGIKKTFFSLYGADLNAGTIECLHDDVNNRVEIILKTAQVKWVFNYKTLQWGIGTGYRGATSETIQTGLPVSRTALWDLKGFAVAQTTNASVFVISGNKLRALGGSAMRAGTTASFTFNWWQAVEGAFYYQGLRYRTFGGPSSASLSGFADAVLAFGGAFSSNSLYPRMECTYQAQFLAPRLTITNSGTDAFEFTQFIHNIKQVGKA